MRDKWNSLQYDQLQLTQTAKIAVWGGLCLLFKDAKKFSLRCFFLFLEHKHSFLEVHKDAAFGVRICVMVRIMVARYRVFFTKNTRKPIIVEIIVLNL